jgi:hypothetical protein
MFGGFNTSFGPLYFTNEIWALSLSGTPTWSLLTPTGTPPDGRNHAAAVYDVLNDRLVVFGGIIYNSPGVATDVWACNFGGSPAWQALNPIGSPPVHVFSGEANATAIYDPSRQQMVVIAPNALRVRDGAWDL